MIEDIVDALARARPPRPLFNQYAKSCWEDLHPNKGAELRRIRLLQHLSCDPRIILLSGHADKSAELTGITLTSEDLIVQGRIPRVTDEQITNRQAAMASWKSSVIWDELARLNLSDKAVLWSAQPFCSRQPLASPKDALNFGLQFLEPLLKHFFGVPVIVRNGPARQALKMIGIQPAATLPALDNEQDAAASLHKAMRFFLDRPKRTETRNSGKSVRDFFVSCRNKPSSSNQDDA